MYYDPEGIFFALHLFWNKKLDRQTDRPIHVSPGALPAQQRWEVSSDLRPSSIDVLLL